MERDSAGPAAPRPPIDYHALAELLKALAYPARLELLDLLRAPKTVRDVRLNPQRSGLWESPDRPAARQTVQLHLDKLLETDLVRAETGEQDGRQVPFYIANPAKLYVIMEAMRSLLVRYAGRGLEPDHTATVSAAAAGAATRGPRVVLVHGVYEGKAYPLTPSTAKDARWTIGRAKGLAVSLDYDPFVSHETAVITKDGPGFAITDLGSKNGTWLNWVPLGSGETRTLEAADVIGVGRSLLVFAAR